MLHLNDRCFYSCLWITPDLRCQKRLWILCFSTTSIKIWRSGAFFAFSHFLHLSEPLWKQKVVVRDLWLVDFDPFCLFCVSRLDALFLKSTVSFTSALTFFYLLYTETWQVYLDSKGEIVPLQLPNPEKTRLRKGENEQVRSRQHLHLLTNTVDATVTVWLTLQKIWIWSMLNMNCRGCRQRFLPLPNLFRKIEGDSVRRVYVCGSVYRFLTVRVSLVLLCG